MTVVNPYIWGLGRRKTSVARVRIKPGTGNFTVNGKPMQEFFTTLQDQKCCLSPLLTVEALESYDIFVNVKGGGTTGQAGAVQLGIARAIKESNPVAFEALRDGGHLTRDSRSKERKKYGRRGARRGFQFSKR